MSSILLWLMPLIDCTNIIAVGIPDAVKIESQRRNTLFCKPARSEFESAPPDLPGALVRCGLAPSKGQARTFIQQGAVSINGDVVREEGRFLGVSDLLAGPEESFLTIPVDLGQRLSGKVKVVVGAGAVQLAATSQGPPAAVRRSLMIFGFA